MLPVLGCVWDVDRQRACFAVAAEAEALSQSYIEISFHEKRRGDGLDRGGVLFLCPWY